jgi:hypothetical protein
MTLTSEQAALFKSALWSESDAVLVELRTNGQTGLIRDWYNAVAAAQFVVWKTKVTKTEATQISGFDWTQVDNMTVGQARIWDLLFDNEQKAIDPSKTNVRSGISECWKGTTAKVAVATAVLEFCKKPASNFEKLFAVGLGSTASPATAATVQLTEYDVTLALAI